MPFVPGDTMTKKSMTYKWVPASSDTTEEPHTWKFENPGSYRDEDDPMKFSVLPVDAVTIILAGWPGHWSVSSITIACSTGADLHRKIRTQVIDGSKYVLVPWWLVKLVGRAQQ